MHAVVSLPRRIADLPPGVIFALRNRQRKRQHQPAKPPPSLLPDLHRQERLCRSSNHTEVKRHAGSRTFGRMQTVADEPIPEAYRPVQSPDTRRWAQYAGVFSDLLADAIRSMVDLDEEEKDLDSLFTGPTVHRAYRQYHQAGLDDFELIAFLVVEDLAVAG